MITRARPAMTQWMDALVDAARELASTSLGFDGGQVTATGPSWPEGFSGSIIALVGDDDSLQIGLGSTREHCVQMARALLGMEPEDEDPEDQDVIDALGEMANVVGGGLKIRMSESTGAMQLGLPIMLRGEVTPARGAEILSATIRWPNDVVVNLLLIHRNGKR